MSPSERAHVLAIRAVAEAVAPQLLAPLDLLLTMSRRGRRPIRPQRPVLQRLKRLKGRSWKLRRQKVIARDGLVCGICGKRVPAADVHVDHILARSLGGSDDVSNLQVAHSVCNMRKRTSVVPRHGASVPIVAQLKESSAIGANGEDRECEGMNVAG